MNILGVFLGTETFQRKNWEGAMEKVCLDGHGCYLSFPTGALVNDLVA